ncbi:unnamed protein product [Ranitomeya imitator]|uniref:Uncharacterized protein n=1 Tax=Ranitomeya imitator TaxID=111125 RepID=A0ABN9L0M9_9NEOB|nr:unnamed protein product [Ranitomeya imitator]
MLLGRETPNVTDSHPFERLFQHPGRLSESGEWSLNSQELQDTLDRPLSHSSAKLVGIPPYAVMEGQRGNLRMPSWKVPRNQITGVNDGFRLAFRYECAERTLFRVRREEGETDEEFLDEELPEFHPKPHQPVDASCSLM